MVVVKTLPAGLQFLLGLGLQPLRGVVCVCGHS